MKFYLSCWSYGYYGKDDEFIRNLYKLNAYLLLNHYGEVHFITDNDGKDRFKDIPFSSVDTSLEILPKDLKILWSLGKILAYNIISKKREPFIHLDNDALFFKKIPAQILNQEIITQHIEHGAYNFYEAEDFIEKIPNKFFLKDKKISYAHNMGIFGGNNLDFIKFYSSKVLELCLDKKNLKFLQETNFKKSFTPPCMSEQYSMSLLADIKNVKVSTLFDSYESFSSEKSKDLGFTHVWGAKTTLMNELNEKIKNIMFHLNIK
jgi:hypothetical protein